MPLLTIQQLFYSIDESAIIADFSLTLKEKEIVAILGESGSGKSTILRLIAGLTQPDSGELLLDNERIIPPSEKLIAGHGSIKLVKQDFGLFPNISLRENIVYELRFYTKDYQKERVDKLLKISNLYPISHRLPREVSGGEQQRTVIARALADEPRLLLLDEPFSHLDRQNKNRLKQEILSIISTEKSGCIFVTHDVADAYGIADKIVIIRKGQTMQIGTPEEIYFKPVNTYVAQLTGDTNLLVAAAALKLTGRVLSAKKKLLIRPEWMRLSPDGINAKIISKIFYGQNHTYQVEVEGLQMNWSNAREFKPGEIMQLAIDHSAIIDL